jgi:hypothetical protein
MLRAGGPDDAPRLAAYHAAVIGTATIGTTITPRPERTCPDWIGKVATRALRPLAGAG